MLSKLKNLPFCEVIFLQNFYYVTMPMCLTYVHMSRKTEKSGSLRSVRQFGKCTFLCHTEFLIFSAAAIIIIFIIAFYKEPKE